MENFENDFSSPKFIEYGDIIIPKDIHLFDYTGRQIPSGEYSVTEVQSPKFGTREVDYAKQGLPHIRESKWYLKSPEGLEYTITSSEEGGEWLESNRS